MMGRDTDTARPSTCLADRAATSLRQFGTRPNIARQAGVGEPRLIIWKMCVGAAAGIAGWMLVAGVGHRLYDIVANPIGYMCLFAALLAVLPRRGQIRAAMPTSG